MDINIIFKIAIIGIIVSIINQVLVKAGKEEIAMMTTLAGLIIVLIMVIDLLGQLFNSIKSIFMFY